MALAATALDWRRASARKAGALAPLMKATGLKYLAQDASSAVVLVKGNAGTHVVVVRLLAGTLAAFSEVAEAREEQDPPALWRKLAEVNARPTLAHLGYSKAKGRFYAVCGVAADSASPTSATGKLLRAMVTEVAALADEQQPSIHDLLTVQ